MLLWGAGNEDQVGVMVVGAAMLRDAKNSYVRAECQQVALVY